MPELSKKGTFLELLDDGGQLLTLADVTGLCGQGQNDFENALAHRVARVLAVRVLPHPLLQSQQPVLLQELVLHVFLR